MNDSFLEDLDLVPAESNARINPQLNNRYITTRKVLSPPLSSNVKTKSDFDQPGLKEDKIISSSSVDVSKVKTNRRSGSQEPRKLSVESKPLSSTPKSDKKKKSQGNEHVIKPVEKQIKTEDLKAKPHDRTVNKLQENKLSSRRRSGSTGNSSRYLESSSKENTRPSTDSSSSRESGSQAELKKDINRRISDGVSSKKSDILEKTDPVMLLNAIKDLISRYTEQESIKILKTMQDLYIHSQANLIKHLMLQTDEVVKELNPHKNSDNIKSLVEENERMREDIFMLRTRNEILQKKINEMALIKEENISLKMKLKELQQ